MTHCTQQNSYFTQRCQRQKSHRRHTYIPTALVGEVNNRWRQIVVNAAVEQFRAVTCRSATQTRKRLQPNIVVVGVPTRDDVTTMAVRWRHNHDVQQRRRSSLVNTSTCVSTYNTVFVCGSLKCTAATWRHDRLLSDDSVICSVCTALLGAPRYE